MASSSLFSKLGLNNGAKYTHPVEAGDRTPPLNHPVMPKSPDVLVGDAKLSRPSTAYNAAPLWFSNTLPHQHKDELPKVVLRQGLRPALYKILPHLLAILAIIAVVQLSFRKVYWMDLVPPTQHILPGITQGGALNLLQVAAKLLELILLASLSLKVMYTAQRYLLGKSGLPLGLIASPHQISTGELLRRKGFWAASAIAVIPNLNYFPLTKPFDTDPPPYYIFNESTALWPDRVTKDSLNAPNSGNNCSDPLSTGNNDCPAGGFRVLYEWGNNMIFDDLSHGSNLTFPNDVGDKRRIVSLKSCKGPAAGRASGMTIHNAVSTALIAYERFARNNFNGTALSSAQVKIIPDATTEIFAPRVDVICNAYTYSSDTIKQQTEMLLPNFNDTEPRKVPETALNFTRPLNVTDFTWVAAEENAVGLSIHGLGVIPTVSYFTEEKVYRQVTMQMPCSVYAQWVPTNTWYEPNTADQVSFETLDDGSRCLDVQKAQFPSETARNMTIGLDWADAANQLILFVDSDKHVIPALLEQSLYDSPQLENGTNFRVAQPGSGNLTQLALGEGDRLRADAVAAVIAAVVTDGLARIAGDGHDPYSSPMFIEDVAGGQIQGLFPVSTASGGQTTPLNTTRESLKNWVRLNPVIERYGYGYTWRGSATTQFGVSVLLVHLLLAAAHSAFVLYRVVYRGEGSGNSFDTIGEIVALALNSSTTSRFQNTCGGVTESSTWQEIVAVRETYDGHLEVVVGEDARRTGSRPVIGKEYGRLKSE